MGLMVLTICRAQEFEHYFTDETLRIDYTLAGNIERQAVYMDEMSIMEHWYGKKRNLGTVPMEGNGQIIVRAHRGGEVIYRNSFSTLFQEWLTYDEARSTSKSFEHVSLIPMPKDTVDITVELYDNRRELSATMTHMVVPTDILIRKKGENHTAYKTIGAAKDMDNSIKIAYVAEGYTSGEMETFIRDARKAMEALFEHSPFKESRDRFNVVAVMTESAESGTSIPSQGIWRDTALKSHFDTFYSDRYLTTLHIKDLHDCLAGTPYEHIIVLVNTENYGGGGILNNYNLSMTHHANFEQVVVHEFGHSFAGLADEYFYDNELLDLYPTDVEPWEQNITTKVDMTGKPGMQKGELIEGAGYRRYGIYRSYEHCRMRENEYPEFCPTCKEAIMRVIDFYTEAHP